jgi:methylaspartate mutase sigma subunit
MNPRSIVLGVIGSDCHSVGNKILAAFFAEKGFNVANLGVMVSQGEFVDAAIETDAAAIVVSSLYGHAELDCQGFKDLCVERGLEDLVLYVGGNLVVGKQPRADVERKFLALGFDRVFFPDSDLEEAARSLERDIAARRAAGG